MPQRFQNRQRSASRPNRTWFRIVTTAIVNIPAASKVLIATGVLGNQGIDETILRTVGMLSIGTDNTAGNEAQVGAFGMTVVKDTAAAAGVASIPGPITEGGDDGWVLYVPFAQTWDAATAVGHTVRSVQYPFDSRGKRIVSTGESLAIVCENAHATEGFDLLVVMRVLSQVRGTR